MTMAVFTVVGNEDTVADVDETMGWGVEFPNGQVALDWNRTIYPKNQRLDHPHISLYGSMQDLRRAAQGNVVRKMTFPYSEDGQ